MSPGLPNFVRDGFALLEGLIPANTCDRLAGECSAQLDRARHAGGTARGGLRNLLQTIPGARAIVHSPRLMEILRSLLGESPFPVRCLLFDKTPDANWAVAWHQDLHIAVAERIETPGFGPWSVKAGVPHVQPPVEVLQRMITVRVHLDDCDETNGALRVIPGSHAHGILGNVAMDQWIQREAVACCARKGGALLIRPLLLHSSASATNPSHRRVLHIEYACDALPNGLSWREPALASRACQREADLNPV